MTEMELILKIQISELSPNPKSARIWQYMCDNQVKAYIDDKTLSLEKPYINKVNCKLRKFSRLH